MKTSEHPLYEGGVLAAPSEPLPWAVLWESQREAVPHQPQL